VPLGARDFLFFLVNEAANVIGRLDAAQPGVVRDFLALYRVGADVELRGGYHDCGAFSTCLSLSSGALSLACGAATDLLP